MSKARNLALWFVQQLDGDVELAIQAIKDEFYCHNCGGLKSEPCAKPKPKRGRRPEIDSDILDEVNFNDRVVCLTTITVGKSKLTSGTIYKVKGVAYTEDEGERLFLEGFPNWFSSALFKKVKR